MGNRTHMGSVVCLALLSLVGVTYSLHGEDAPATSAPTHVGALGRPDSITFTGNETFAAEALRDGLRRSSDFIVAAHPSAPFAPFLGTLEKAVREGYRQTGFPDAEATATLDATANGVRVSIEEGPRYKNGEIVISGVDAELEAALRKRLREGVPKSGEHFPMQEFEKASEPKETPEEDPVWGEDWHTEFHEKATSGLTYDIRRYLAEYGYFFAEVEVSIQPDPASETATLQVTVADLGPEPTLNKVRVTFAGNHKNSTKDVMAFLGLEPGMPVNNLVIEDARDRLYHSGRFLKSHVRIERTAPDSADVDLVMDINELPESPPLLEALTREEKTMLKAREWLLGGEQRGEELVLSITETNQAMEVARWVYAPSKGLVGTVRIPPAFWGDKEDREQGDTNDPSGPGSSNLDFVMLVTPTQTGACFPTLQRMLMFPGLSTHAQFWLNITGNEDAQETEKPFQFVMGLGVSSKTEAPFMFDIKVDPVCMVGGYRRETNLTARWEGQTLTLTGQDEKLAYSLTIDEDTGRSAVHITSLDGKFPIAMEISGQAGAFEQLEASVTELVDAVPNAFDKDAPVSSTLLFLAEFADRSARRLENPPPALGDIKEGLTLKPETVQEGIRVFKQLVEKGLLGPLDHMAQHDDQDDDQDDTAESFSVPYLGDMARTPNPILAMVGQLGLECTAPYLPEDSWPVVLSSEIVQMAHGNTRYTRKVFESLYEDTAQIGPVGYLLIAQVMKLVNPRQSTRFAERGLEQMTAADFEKDWKLVMPRDPAQKERLDAALATLSELSDADIDALGRFLAAAETDLKSSVAPDKEAAKADVDAAKVTETFRGFIDILRKQRGQPWEDVLKPAMAHAWKHGLKTNIEKSLTDVAGGRAPEGVAASVNDAHISWATVDTIVNAQMKANPPSHPASAQAMLSRLEQTVVQTLVNHELLFQEYENTLQTEHPLLMEKLVDEFTRIRLQGSRENLMEHLATTGQSLEGFRKEVLADTLMRQKMSGVPEPTEEELRAYFGKHMGDYSNRNQTVHLHMISVPTQSVNPPANREGQQALLEQIRIRIEGGADFTEMARQHSVAEQQERGCFGHLVVNEMPGVLREAVRTMDVNELSEILEFGGRFHLARVEGRQRAGQQSFEQARMRVTAAVLEANRFKAVVTWLRELQGNAQVMTYMRLPSASDSAHENE